MPMTLHPPAHTKHTLIILLTAALMTACSAKVSSDGGLPTGSATPSPAPNTPQVSQDKIPAINLDGVWTSDCATEPRGFGTVKVVMTIKDHAFSRTITYYNDWDCKSTDSTDTISGQFSFQKSKPDSVYEVEYLVTSGTTYRMAGNIKRVGEKLWIGLLANADYPPTVEMNLIK